MQEKGRSLYRCVDGAAVGILRARPRSPLALLYRGELSFFFLSLDVLLERQIALLQVQIALFPIFASFSANVVRHTVFVTPSSLSATVTVKGNNVARCTIL